MTDRRQPIRDLLVRELADDWQPHSFGTNRLPYRERKRLEEGPAPSFVEEQLEAARRGRKRTSLAVGVALATVLLPFSFSDPSGAWSSFVNALLLAVPFAIMSLATARHMHWRKREMIYRAFRLMSDAPEPAPETDAAPRPARPH